jgi:hypothetical protein
MTDLVSPCTKFLALLIHSQGFVSTIRKVGALLALTAGLMASASAVSPTKPAAAERQFQAWLAAFNDGTQTKLQEFARKNKADQTVHVADDSRFREMTGGFEFKKTEERTPTKFVALLKEKDSDTFARITLEVDAAEPHKITTFQLFGTEAPAEFRIHSMNERDAIAALKKVVEERTEPDQFSGAIAITKRGAMVFEQA